MTFSSLMKALKSKSDKKHVSAMKRFGIRADRAIGVSIPALRGMAKSLTPNHSLAARLWDSGIHEARILASMVDEKDKITDAQLERWVSGFDSWDVCDQVCDNLISDTPFAYKKAFEWAKRKEEFVRRAGFTLMAMIGWFGKGRTDAEIEKFLPVIKKYSVDERNFVRKAVNWALRNIGKKSMKLNAKALKTAREIARINSKSARWIAADAIRELLNEKIRARIRVKEKMKQ